MMWIVIIPELYYNINGDTSIGFFVGRCRLLENFSMLLFVDIILYMRRAAQVKLNTGCVSWFDTLSGWLNLAPTNARSTTQSIHYTCIGGKGTAQTQQVYQNNPMSHFVIEKDVRLRASLVDYRRNSEKKTLGIYLCYYCEIKIH